MKVLQTWPKCLTNHLTQWLVSILSCAAIISAATAQSAASKPPAKSTQPTAASPAEKKAPRPVPYRGTIKLVNVGSRTFTIGERVFLVTDATRIQKAGKALQFTEALKGEWVTGSYRKMEDGKLLASTLYVGGKAADAEPPSDTESSSPGKKRKDSARK